MTNSFVQWDAHVMTDIQDSPDAPFDPAEHNIDDVLEYVKEHPDEAEAIAAAEASRESPRSTLLKALAAPTDDGDDDDAGDETVEPDGGEEDGDVTERASRSGTHVLEVGESPAIVARRLLGRGSYGNQIVRANPGVKWKPGTEIVIPEVD